MIDTRNRSNPIRWAALVAGSAIALSGCTATAPAAAPTPTVVSCSPSEATVQPQEYISTESAYVLTRVDRSEASAAGGSVQVPLTAAITSLDAIRGATVEDEQAWTEGILAALIRANYLPENSGTDVASGSISDVPDGTLLGNGGHAVDVEVVVSCRGEEYFRTRLHSTMPNNYAVSISCPDVGPATKDARVAAMRQELASYCAA